MGVPQLLKEVIRSVGRDIDLRFYVGGIDASTGLQVRGVRDDSRENKSRRVRPLRLGIDINTWVMRATQGNSDMLGDDKHLSNYGRATLLAEQQRKEQAARDRLMQQADDLDDASGGDGTVPSRRDAAVSRSPELEARVQDYVQTCRDYVIHRLQALQQATKIKRKRPRSEGATEDNTEEEICMEILAVFDGLTPPIKQNVVSERKQTRQVAVDARDGPVVVAPDEGEEEDRIKAFKRAGAGKYHSHVITSIVERLRELHIPFMVAPYEADGQLVYLRQKKYIDVIVSEDSDFLAYGLASSPVLYKLNDCVSSTGVPRGTLIRHEDLSSYIVSTSSTSSSGVTNSLDLRDFTPGMLAVLFVATGSDYCHKLKGIGIVTAGKIVRSAFYLDDEGHTSVNRSDTPPLENVFQELYEKTSDRARLTPEFKQDYEKLFMAAVLMFRHPVVFDPVLGRCVAANCPEDPGNQVEDAYYNALGGNGDPELMRYKPYAAMRQDLQYRFAKVTGSPHVFSLESPSQSAALAILWAEGWIVRGPSSSQAFASDQIVSVPESVPSRKFQLRPGVVTPPRIQQLYRQATAAKSGTTDVVEDASDGEDDGAMENDDSSSDESVSVSKDKLDDLIRDMAATAAARCATAENNGTETTGTGTAAPSNAPADDAENEGTETTGAGPAGPSDVPTNDDENVGTKAAGVVPSDVPASEESMATEKTGAGPAAPIEVPAEAGKSEMTGTDAPGDASTSTDENMEKRDEFSFVDEDEDDAWQTQT
jgi:5'-3' exonuclease